MEGLIQYSRNSINLFISSSHFITCGQDGDIHVFETKTDQVEHIRCSDQCHCLAVHVCYLIILKTNLNLII